MSQLPPLNALKYFESAARTGSYTKAARELHVTPAAVSQQVRQLEDFYGRKLFVRYNNRISLSDAGQAVFAGIAPALEDISSMTARFMGGVDRSRLVVSVVPSLAECWFVPRFTQFALSGAAPKLDLRVEEDPVDFSTHRIDLRFTYGANLYPDLQMITLFRDRVLPMCSPQFGQHVQEHGGIIDLSDEFFIHTSWGANYASHPNWSEWLAKAGMKRRVNSGKGHRTGASRLALDFARRGMGVALGQEKMAEDFLRRGELVALSQESLPLGHDYCAYYPEVKARKPGLLQLIAMAAAD